MPEEHQRVELLRRDRPKLMVAARVFRFVAVVVDLLWLISFAWASVVSDRAIFVVGLTAVPVIMIGLIAMLLGSLAAHVDEAWK